jgi:hypothetical protein
MIPWLMPDSQDGNETRSGPRGKRLIDCLNLMPPKDRSTIIIEGRFHSPAMSVPYRKGAADKLAEAIAQTTPPTSADPLRP